MDITEIQELFQSSPISMNKIEWWLLKYSDDFKKSNEISADEHSFKSDDVSTARLPSSFKTNDNDIFINVYESLDSLSKLHRFESYFRDQLIEFEEKRESVNNVKNWINKNEKLGTKKFSCFLIDYLDYDEDDKVEHLKVFIYSATDLNIFVDIKDFKYTVRFLETFDHLYWKNN